MKRPHAGIAVSLSTLAMLAGCGDGKSPVEPSPSAALFPAFGLSGRVVDPTYRPVAGSRVEIIDGPRTGTVEITDEDGHFTMEGFFTGPVTVRASKDGYQPETRIMPPPRLPPSELVEGANWQMQFYLAPLGPWADIAGEYTLTITGDRACTSLPAAMRSRTYTAQIDPPSRSGFSIATLRGATFFSEPCAPGQPRETCVHNRFGIGLAGDYLSIGGGVIEQLGDKGFLRFEGGAEGSFGPNGIAEPFRGAIIYCPVELTQIDQGTFACLADGGLYCDSSAHQLSLTRR
jgi:hypothetical protein